MGANASVIEEAKAQCEETLTPREETLAVAPNQQVLTERNNGNLEGVQEEKIEIEQIDKFQ